MTDEELTELMNREIDGLNTKSDSSKLRAYLDNNRGARQLYDELRKTVDALNRIEQADPPSYLRKHILNSIGSPEQAREQAGGVLHRFVDMIRLRPAPKYALVFVSGLCVGVLLLLLFSPTLRDRLADPSSVSGAMISPLETEGYKLIDVSTISDANISGTVKTLRRNEFLVAELRIESPQRIHVEAEFDPTLLTFNGYTVYSGVSDTLTVAEGQAVLSCLGLNHGAFILKESGGKASELAINIRAGQALLFHATLRTESLDRTR